MTEAEAMRVAETMADKISFGFLRPKDGAVYWFGHPEDADEGYVPAVKVIGRRRVPLAMPVEEARALKRAVVA